MKRVKLNEEVFIPLDCLIHIIEFLDDFDDQIAVFKAFEHFHKDIKARVFKELYDGISLEEIWSQLRTKREGGFLLLVYHFYEESKTTYMFVPRNIDEVFDNEFNESLMVIKYPFHDKRIWSYNFKYQFMLFQCDVDSKENIIRFLKTIENGSPVKSYKSIHYLKCKVSYTEVKELVKKKEDLKFFRQLYPRWFSQFILNYLSGKFGTDVFDIQMKEILRIKYWSEQHKKKKKHCDEQQNYLKLQLEEEGKKRLQFMKNNKNIMEGEPHNLCIPRFLTHE